MVGFLLFVGTISIIPLYFFGIIFLYEVVFRKKEILYNINKNRQFFISICIFVFLCLINSVLHGFISMPNFILLPFTVLMSFGFKKEDIKVFVFLTFIEIGIGLFEQITGISSILPSDETVDFAGEELLYFRKAVGISNGSAAFGIKILFCLFFVFLLGEEVSRGRRILYSSILYLGILTTFNRTALIVAILFLLVFNFDKHKRFLFHTIKGQRLLTSFLIIVVIAANALYDSIFYQLARGGDNVDISGRDEIWNSFFAFIKEHLFFGNGSCHLLVPYSDGTRAHAHNSFIQLLADNGIILASIFLVILLSRLNKRNRIYVLCLFVASLTQYVVFWGMSAADVFLYIFLCNRLITTSNKNNIINESI